ncbi:MAG TPA: type IV toxin-antitoxin system AbiEi family antitoxin domain-containing protein [Solirubrobacteraceae bacterium]|nr:type IV toxin-antitoxin system AbiEi family antitoxin domain-containing protein [Solirubrobacteraceae bacterium]
MPVNHPCGGKRASRDRRIAALADRQHGVVARRQLIALGYTAREIERRIEAGRLHRVHRGVYAVGHRRLTRHGRWMAAVLACGPGAVLSHHDAAALHSLRRSASRKAIDVSTTGRHRSRPGLHVHNVRHLHPADCTTLDGIPVTSIHRTLLDYAEAARPQQLRWAFEAYDRMDLIDMRALDAVVARNPGRRGIKALSALTAVYRGASDTRSGNERRFLELIRKAGLPEPSVNVVVEGIVVDFFWPAQRLVFEVDSYTYHHTPADRAEDRRKERILTAAGCAVRRVTDSELETAPHAVVGDVEGALSACAAASGR